MQFLAKEPCLNICLNVNLYRPDVNEYKCKAYVNKTVNHFILFAVNQMQVRILG